MPPQGCTPCVCCGRRVNPRSNKPRSLPDSSVPLFAPSGRKICVADDSRHYLDNVCPGSDWRNSKHALFMDITVSQQPGITYIIEYGPTTTYGSTTVGFTVGITISESPGVTQSSPF